MLTIDEIIKIGQDEVKKHGMVLKERKAVSTDSWYFEIYYGKDEMLIRISDHASKKKIKTLRTDYNFSREGVRRFFKNRCEDLRYRRTKRILGMR